MQLETGTSRARTSLAILSLVVLLLAAFVAPAAASVAPASSAASADRFPDQILLPNGFQPEGIAIGFGHHFWVGSIPTGAVYSGDLLTGEGSILVPATAGRNAIGMKVDERSGYLFVAGGPSGMAFVYNAFTGADVAQYTMAPGFINDVTLTNDAAYFTNSATAEFYRIPLGPAGSVPGQQAVQTIPLGGDWNQVTGFNSNGIAATADGKWLIIVNTAGETLYRVDPLTGDATAITGVSLPNGDGLWLQGHMIWVVQNVLNRISVVVLSTDYTSGTVVDTITSPLFRVPTTIAPFGSSFYAVNARFGTPPTPDTDYDVVQVPQK